MSETDLARNSLLDFAALGSKLHDLLNAEKQMKQFVRAQADAQAMAAYQQEVLILTDQIRRLRNSLFHSPLEDVAKQIDGSTEEAVSRWESISKSIREIGDVTEAIHKLTEATKALAGVNELSHAMGQANEAKRMNDAVKALEEVNKIDEILRHADEAKKINDLLRGADDFRKMNDLLEHIKKPK